MSAGRVLSTIHLPHRPDWTARVDGIDRTSLSHAALIRRLVREGPRHDGVIVDASVGPGERYSDLVAAAALARRRSGPPVVLAECTWKLGDSRADRLACRAGALALDSPRTAYCVLSSDERPRFARTWGVDEDRVFFTPYCYTLDEHELEPAAGLGSGVFSGGNAVRDYEPLVEAARGLDAPVTIATTLLDGRGDLPANVSAGPVPRDRFAALVREARVNVVAMQNRPERSAGQQTYLGAMALGKLVVVPDVLGVHDYIADRRTGLVVPPDDPRALREAIAWALDPANDDAVRAIGEAARRDALERFGPEAYAAALLDVVDAMRERAAPTTRSATDSQV